MLFTPAKAKMVAMACVIRYDRNEGTIQEIIEANYVMSVENEKLVKAAIISLRPEVEVEVTE